MVGSWWLSGKEPTYQCRRCRFTPWVGKIPREGNGTHSSILVWEIPWTEEPGGLQSMGSQRVGHDLETKKQQRQLDISLLSVEYSEVLTELLHFSSWGQFYYQKKGIILSYLKCDIQFSYCLRD